MKALRIKRFKGFLDSGWIEIKPITLFFGYNSAGKSSIINVLLMLKQSLENSSMETPFVFSNRKGVDLGTFEDIVHKHKIEHENPIEIGIKIDIRKELEKIRKKVKDLEINIDEEIEFTVQITYNQKRRVNVIPFFEIKDKDEKIILKMKLSQVATNAKLNFESDIYDIKKEKIEINWHNFLPIITIKGNTTHPLRYITEALSDAMALYYEKLSNIGPVRAIPERTQQFTGENPLTVGVQGEEALKLLYLSKMKGKSKENTLETRVNDWLKQYNYRFEWKTLKGNFGQFLLIDTRKENENIEVSIKDVGFGISQVLPIVIQVFDASNENTVIIEQPEIHLHSKAQAELGDLFIKAIRDNEEEGSKKNLIIETHSENLLLRLRRRIAESYLGEVEKELKISKDDIAVYYVSNSKGFSEISKIEFDNCGNIKDIPEEFSEFFSDDYNEIMKLSEANAKIKYKESIGG